MKVERAFSVKSISGDVHGDGKLPNLVDLYGQLYVCPFGQVAGKVAPLDPQLAYESVAVRNIGFTFPNTYPERVIVLGFLQRPNGLVFSVFLAGKNGAFFDQPLEDIRASS